MIFYWEIEINKFKTCCSLPEKVKGCTLLCPFSLAQSLWEELISKESKKASLQISFLFKTNKTGEGLER